MSLLYEAEAKEITPGDVLAALPVEAAPFATDLVAGVGDHQEELDGLISRFSRDWAIERMPAVDRALLFSTDDSARFVNGVLAAIAREVRPG
jgi:N utilization substance protein B